jgi:hypothetical protein
VPCSVTGKGTVMWGYIVPISFILLFSFSSFHAVFGRDVDGRYAASPLKSWFDQLQSKKGPCCSDADGSAVSDADWEAVNDPSKPTIHYRVRVESQWLDVDDTAVITEPNLSGRTMVWPFYQRSWNAEAQIHIRCFIPGPMI